MITLIGTGHIFNLSPQLTATLDDIQPDLICVELDQQRYHALLLKQTQPETYKQKQQQAPFIYKLLARFQENMAEQYGVQAGQEMLTAIHYAQTHQLPLELIDMNAQHLFQTMWYTMPLTEKLKLFLSGFTGLFVSKKHVEEELETYQNDYQNYLEEIGKRFPTIKKTLIDKRNAYMAQRLVTLHQNHHQIIACIGDGHIPGISNLLNRKDQEYQTIRLKELRQHQSTSSDPTLGHFSINYHQEE
jgi:pheromone shutdown protein TraB